MARQPLEPGEYGVITVKPFGAGQFQARTYYRHRNGVYSRPSATGRSREAAKAALRKKITKMATTATTGTVNRNTLLDAIAAEYFETLEHQAHHGDMSPNTVRTYRSSWKHIRPYLGALRAFELEDAVDVIDEMLKDLRVHRGFEETRKAKSLLSGVCGFAIRRRAMTQNPVKSVERLGRSAAEKRAAAEAVPDMSVDEIATMRHGLAAFAKLKVTATDQQGRRLGKRGAVWADLPDMADASLATGQRIGELLALSGLDIFEYHDDGTEWHLGDDDASDADLLPGRHIAVVIDAHIVRVKGAGLRRVPGRKSGQVGITVGVSDWAAPMFLRRRAAAGAGPLFPATGGGWLDGDNTNKRLRQALDHATLPWVSARVWRKTVGTLVGHELGSEATAEQLGNTPKVAREHYITRRRIATKAASVLDVLTPNAQVRPNIDTKSTKEAVNHAHSSDQHGVLSGETVGAAGLEPATARNSETVLPN